MPTSFLDAATEAQIKALDQDAFATDFGLGKQVSLVLYRDTEEDGTGVAQAAQTVLMVMAGAGYANRRGEGVALTSESGEFSRFAPFNIRHGDRFTVDGIAGKITAPPFPPDVRGVVRAAFELEG